MRDDVPVPLWRIALVFAALATVIIVVVGGCGQDVTSTGKVVDKVYVEHGGARIPCATVDNGGIDCAWELLRP